MFKRIAIGIFFILVLAASLAAEVGLNDNIEFRVEQIIEDNFPKMKVYVSVTERARDKARQPRTLLLPSHFSALVDGKKITSKISSESFHSSEEMISYYMMISTSGAMSGPKIEGEKVAAKTMVDLLREKDVLTLYSYADEPTAEFQQQIGSAEKKEEMYTLIDDIEVQQASGRPKFWDALWNVLIQMEADETERKVLIIVSGGRESDSRFSEEQVLAKLKKLNLPIYAVGMDVYGRRDATRLDTLANASGGEYFFQGNDGRLADHIKEYVEQISKGYILQFRIKEIKGDDEYHELSVQVRDGEGEASEKVSMTKNFFARIVPTPVWIYVLIIVFGSLILIGVIVLLIFVRRNRVIEAVGIKRRKCPECRRRMKDDWDECVFCKYVPPKKKKKKKKKDK